MTKRELGDVIRKLQNKNERLTDKLDRLQGKTDYEKGLEEGKNQGKLFGINLEPMCNIVAEAKFKSKKRRKELFIRIGSTFAITVLVVIGIMAITGVFK